MRASTAAEALASMITLNTELSLPSRAFWYIALRSLVVAFFVVLLGSLVQLVTTLPGATCNGHPCNAASGAHLAAFIYLFAAFLVVRAVLNFKWSSFVVTDRSITINSGVLQRNSNTIRFDRVQDVNTSRDLLHMLLGLTSISIWTASPDQSAGNMRRPDGRIVLEAEDADWLRDYVSDPKPAAAAVSGAMGQGALGAAPPRGNGAVAVASLIAAGLVVLAVMAAAKKSPPAPAVADTASVATPAPAYVAKRAVDGRTHLHVVRTAPAPQVPVAGVPAAAPPPVAPVQLAPRDYGIACAIHPQQATSAVRSCAELVLARRCTHEGDFPSKPTAEPAVLTVVNKSDESVKFYWLNTLGNRVLYATLPPGGHVDQQSHAGAHWLVSTAEGQCLGVFDAATTKIGIF